MGAKAYQDERQCICHSENPDEESAAFRDEIEVMPGSTDYNFTDKEFLPNNANFAKWRFDGPVVFHRATFQGEADFSDAIFPDRAFFNSTTFKKPAAFISAKFKDGHFRSATFEAMAGFRAATFEGQGDFVEATFKEEADFRRAMFRGEADFEHARFESAALFVGEEDNRVFSEGADADFRRARFHQPEKVVFQHVFLGRARFLRADVRQVDFTDVEWARRPLWGPRWRPLVERQDRLGRGIRWLCRKWPPCLKPRGRFAVWDELAPEKEDREKDYELIGQLYRRLKHNYEEQRDPIRAGDFHFGEMHMRRLFNPAKNRLLRFLKRNLSFLALYRWISGYGEDYLLALGWMACVIVAFALGYAYIPALALHTGPSGGESQVAAGWSPHLLYSVRCFFLRGRDPFEPVHLAGHYASVAQAIIGPALIAMFVLALGRRFKR